MSEAAASKKSGPTGVSAADSTLPATISDLVRHQARELGAAPAIQDGDFRLSYAQLDERVQTVSAALVGLGVQAGDRVALWAPNGWEWIVAACSIQRAGAVLVPLNTRMRGEEAADILQRSRAVLLFSVGEFLGNYLPAMLDGHHLAHLRQVVVLGSAPRRTAELAWEALQSASCRTPEREAELARRAGALSADTVADLMFTSGTTGRPKGVLTTHGATIRAFAAWSQAVGLEQGARYLIVNPFFHSFGYKAGWVAALIQGACIYPMAVFDAEGVMRCIQNERIQFLPGPPTLFLTMLAHPGLKEFDLSSLTGAVTGSANVPPVLIERMRTELGIAHVTTAYGLTECGGCATVCDPSDDAQTVAHTCGRALPGTQVRVADEHGHALPPGATGEVQLYGYHVMKGYFEDEKATAEAFTADGWLRTGDVGVLDERGYLRITDRLKDMFICGGFNVYPAEVERLLSAHPAVAQVAVVGMDDERMGEVGCAFLVAKGVEPPSAEAMTAWSREHMANYKVPRRWEWRPHLPVNASNKVDKKRLALELRTESQA